MNKGKSGRFFISTEEFIIIESLLPKEQFCYTPSIDVLPNETIVVSHDLGGDIESLSDYTPFPESSQKMLSRVYLKRKADNSFNYVKTFGMCHARLFTIAERVYIIGHNGAIQIAFSDDYGESWSELFPLTDYTGWHASSCNVWKTAEKLYLCMERRTDGGISGWNVAGLSPHILSAGLCADLSVPSSWKISCSFSFSDLFNDPQFKYFGIPFRNNGFRSPSLEHLEENKIVRNSPMGWLEGNVVQIMNRSHIWHDPSGKTFHIFLRCHTAGVGYAAILKVVEDDNGSLFTDFVRTPGGEKLVFLPFPGGHNKFYMLYDELSQLYWMASTQASESMNRVDLVSNDLHGLPNNERHRLVLHFSKNCVDWLFSGVISIGDDVIHARNYPAMVISGDDLLIVTRAGNSSAKNNQYTNLIMMHVVPGFRDLIY